MQLASSRQVPGQSSKTLGLKIALSFFQGCGGMGHGGGGMLADSDRNTTFRIVARC